MLSVLTTWKLECYSRIYRRCTTIGINFKFLQYFEYFCICSIWIFIFSPNCNFVLHGFNFFPSNSYKLPLVIISVCVKRDKFCKKKKYFPPIIKYLSVLRNVYYESLNIWSISLLNIYKYFSLALQLTISVY